MRAPVIYISGPISDPSTRVAIANMARFFVAESKLLQAGFAPINPAADIISLLMCPQEFLRNEDLLWERLMGKDEGLVKASDGLLQLPRWETSPGAILEHGWAVEAGNIAIGEDMDNVCREAMVWSVLKELGEELRGRSEKT